MIDPKNNVTISGGLVADPEVVNDNVLKMRIGVNFAGSEKDSDNKSGYFDVVFYTNDANNHNVKFVKAQIDNGNFSKGTSLVLAGRLVQERWKNNDGDGRSKVVIVAEAITYAGGKAANADNEGNQDAPVQKAEVEVPTTF